MKKPFNYVEAIKDLSKVVTARGWKVIEMHLFDANVPYPLHVLIQSTNGEIINYRFTKEGKTAYGSSAWDLYLLESPKTIDWTKLPEDTLVEIPDKILRYLHSSWKNCPSHIFVYDYGATSQTAGGIICEVSKAKLIEQPVYTEWFGGECPVPEGVVVEIISRDGVTSKGDSANLDWEHTKIDQMYDIMAYRIIGVADGYTPYFEGREF